MTPFQEHLFNQCFGDLPDKGESIKHTIKAMDKIIDVYGSVELLGNDERLYK